MSKSRFRPSPAMVVACTSLVLSMGGVGYAATGGTFVLGSVNSAGAPTALTSKTTNGATLVVNNKGGRPAAAFTSQDGVAPFAVNRNTKVGNLNADLVDGLDSSELVLAGDEIPSASVWSNSSQDVSNVTATTLSAAGEEFDHGDLWDWTDDPKVFTVDRPGTYLLTATVMWHPNASGYRRVEIFAAGSSVAGDLGPPNQEALTVQNVSGIAHLDEGEKVHVTVNQGSGGTLQARLDRFQIAYVGR